MADTTYPGAGQLPDETNATILVVDDTPTNLNVLLPTLEEAGFDILVATDGRQALQRAALGSPDLILLDILMPGIDGYETCRQLKQDANLREIPVIFMTALNDTKEKLAAFAAGGVDYVTKPFSSEEVLERVRTHLTLRRLQRTLQEKNRLLEATTAQLTALTAALTHFLQTGSLPEATERLLESALHHAQSSCGFMGMFVGARNGPQRARVLAVKGIPASGSQLHTPWQAMREAIARDGFSEQDLGALESYIGPVLAETQARLSRGEAPESLVHHHDCMSLPVIQGTEVVGWFSVIDAAADVAEINGQPITQLLHGAGVLCSYERLKQREAESQRHRQHAEETVTYLREELRNEQHAGRIIGTSEAMRQTLVTVERVARTESTVLILGETGTGKELVARAIHDLSSRHARSLIKINCAAIPENLVESELFGHEKGAFTGATETRKGRFELADGGTLFLDEIGDMPLLAQTRLLRVLQEQEFERVGGSRSIRVDVRVLAATHRDLKRLVAEERFREDLYYRLNVIPIELPPLRDRPHDIMPLAHFFVSRFAAKHGVPIERISEKSVQRLQAYHWPGNVRELENILERAVILSNGPTLELSSEILPAGPESQLARTEPVVSQPEPAAVSGTLEEMQHEYILRVLERTRWMIEGEQGAAAQLGLKPSTLRNRMLKLGIHKVGPVE